METVLLAAILFEKGILNKGEANAIVKLTQNETLSSSLQEMIVKVGVYLRTNQRRNLHLDEINAVDLLPKHKDK